MDLGAMALLRYCGENVSATRAEVKVNLNTLTLTLSLYKSLKIRLHTIKSAYLKW